MKLTIPHNKLLFALGTVGVLAIGSASAGWVWNPAPASMIGGMYQAPGMRAMHPNPMMGRTHQVPAMIGMYRAPMMGGMYRAPAMGGTQGFTMNNQRGMDSGNIFKIIQETWTPPVY